ncbi:MAG TPA: class I SAM-dependent methyltransferase [Pyrinomonadaceae bacterium]|nr:class I SAM-dependent methyltransferase [Pyrinomonadaceae bacterium]
MSTTSYKEFEWSVPEAGNGDVGEGLTRAFIERIRSLEGVKTICDLGCGNGYMAGGLAELGYDVTGIDASESGIAVARDNYQRATFVQALVDSSLHERTGLKHFDLVISSDVIEHLYRPDDLIEAAHSLLAPGGRFLVGTPYHGYWKNLMLSATGKMDAHFGVHDVGGHIKFFSKKTLSNLLLNHGFSDLKFSYYGRAPWLWKNMICLARKSC